MILCKPIVGDMKKKNKGKVSDWIVTPISRPDSDVRITFGANASGLRDSICLRVARTVSSWMGLLKHP